jgi:prephenate dehydrogenase
VAIVGVGLIGGSVGQALRAKQLAKEVVGIGRSTAKLDEAVALGAIDRGSTSLEQGLQDADIVVVCTPVDRVAADIIAAARATGPNTLITDAGSTKQSIVEACEADDVAIAKFVAAHPIAGSERSGAAHARADLYEGRVCILTPTAQTPIAFLERAKAFWSSIGARIIEIDPATHDRHLARTSHLPHALAAALAAIVTPAMVPLAGGAYRDMSRVAGADGSLWVKIFLENRGAVIQALSDYNQTLRSFESALVAGDAELLRNWWESARVNRLAYDLQNGLGSVPSGGSGE